MNLYDPARPTLGNGLPTFIGEMSHVPLISVMPLPGGYAVELRVMLRNYDGGANGLNYSYFTKQIPVDELGHFFLKYEEDPEETIESYFGWKPRPPAAKTMPKALSQEQKQAIDEHLSFL